MGYELEEDVVGESREVGLPERLDGLLAIAVSMDQYGGAYHFRLWLLDLLFR